MYIFHAGRRLNKAWISSWKEAGGKIQRLIYILRVRKKIYHIYICIGITSRCNSDHLWRVRVQVNFIFFFPIWTGSLQNDLPPLQWGATWYSHLGSSHNATGLLYVTKRLQQNGWSSTLCRGYKSLQFPSWALSFLLFHHLLLGVTLSWAALWRGPPWPLANSHVCDFGSKSSSLNQALSHLPRVPESGPPC